MFPCHILRKMWKQNEAKYPILDTSRNFWTQEIPIHTLTKYHGWLSDDDKIGRTCSTNDRVEKCTQNFSKETCRKKRLGRPHKCENNIKTDSRWDNMEWIYVAQDMVQSQAFVNTTMNLMVSWCQVSNTASFIALNHTQYCSRQLGRSPQFNYQWLQSFLFAATLKLGQRLIKPPT